MKVVE
jgi:centromere protein J